LSKLLSSHKIEFIYEKLSAAAAKLFLYYFIEDYDFFAENIYNSLKEVLGNAKKDKLEFF
jgi:hypothetical protein